MTQFYQRQGNRIFILQAPTTQVKKVQNLKIDDSLFICTRSTDLLIRKAASPYMFTELDDRSNILLQHLLQFLFDYGYINDDCKPKNQPVPLDPAVRVDPTELT